MSRLREAIEVLESQINENTEKISKLEKQTKIPPVEILVFCVVHPCPEGSERVIICPEDNDQLVILNPPAANKTFASTQFYFERVFDGFAIMSMPISRIFESASQLIHSCLDGFNVFVFFYGAPENIKNYLIRNGSGFIYLTAERIFNTVVETPSADNWMYSVKASNWDIYNNDIIDLLTDGEDQMPHAVIQDLDGKGYHISNLTQVEIWADYEIEKILNLAEENRGRFKAKKNQDLRMCSLFQFHVQGYNTVTKEEKQGSVFIVQLADNESGYSRQVPDWESFIVQLATQKFQPINLYNELMRFIKRNYEKPSKTLVYATVLSEEEHLSDSSNTLKFVSKLSSTHKRTFKRPFEDV